MFRVLGFSLARNCEKAIATSKFSPLSAAKVNSRENTCAFSNVINSSVCVRGIKIYTKTGDKGKTSLYNGQRRQKIDPIFDALGSIDELSSCIGIAYSHIQDIEIKQSNVSEFLEQLEIIQSRLQDVGSCVATPSPGRAPRQVSFPPEIATNELEKWIDEMTNQLPPLKQFILPSGGKASSALHLSRSVCRRAERCVLMVNEVDEMPKPVMVFLNRLSDYLFTAARFACLVSGKQENSVRMYSGDELGRGAGKGGGSGGSVRDAGGSFGKREAALEGEYFHRMEVEQLKELKAHLEEEVGHHKREIKRHEEAIKRHQSKISKLGKH